MSLGIAATSTQPAGHVHVVGGVCQPRFWCRVSPDHGGMGSLYSTVVDRLVLGCQEFSTARWIHVAMWMSVPLYCHGGMGSPFGVHCRHMRLL